MTIVVETAKHVGRPKFLLPTSENTWPVSLRSFVHRITSHGAEVELGPSRRLELAMEDCLECVSRKVGVFARGEASGDVDRRDWKRRSKGRRGGVVPIRESEESIDRVSLCVEDKIEPWRYQSKI